MMKKLLLYFIILSAFAFGAQAHEGSIGIYATTLGDDCDCDVQPYAFWPLYIIYFQSDAGPDEISGAEFKLVKSEPTNLTINSFTAVPGALTIGQIETGIGITFPCNGSGSSYVQIGTIEVFSLAAFDWTLNITEHPTAEPEPGLNIIGCDALKTKHPVLGGWFHEGEGNCEISAESTTWGAIKSIYAD